MQQNSVIPIVCVFRINQLLQVWSSDKKTHQFNKEGILFGEGGLQRESHNTVCLFGFSLLSHDGLLTDSNIIMMKRKMV